RRAGRKLGWQVYDQELLEYMAQDRVVRQGLVENLPGPSAEGGEARLGGLLKSGEVSQGPGGGGPGGGVVAVGGGGGAWALGAGGEGVLLGRGAGGVLPGASTLNVRVVAPLAERIAYMGQWLRLSVEEAAEKVRSRDERRADFLATHFQRQPGDVHQYDLVL